MNDDGETTYETLMFLCFNRKYTFICIYWWTRQRINNTLIVVERYLRLMVDKTIPDSAEPRLESFYPLFVVLSPIRSTTVLSLSILHKGVVDPYNVYNGISYTVKLSSAYCINSQHSPHMWLTLDRIDTRKHRNASWTHLQENRTPPCHSRSRVYPPTQPKRPIIIYIEHMN